ncbi:nucleoid-associated protein [Clostridium sp. Ade.TY]|uniref:nucleoid-associated protein n=1 Tax=Clostridium sp. Ade.TY TaxID=1391647 RepID=UPI000403D94C|nr:nucleoid-associated protein [Clostridium sp. Ade.TY]
MEYINDININDAVIHVLDANGGEPILNEYYLDLNEEAYKFIYKHIEKCLKNDDLKYAKFNEERSIVKEVTQDFLNGIDNNLLGLSKELARQMFAIMNGNTNIPSCDLIVASIVTDKGPMIAILKMDYIKNFTHKVDFIDNKIGIGIIPQSAGLPGSSQKISKAAFIKPIRKDEKYNLMVLDTQKKSKNEDEYGANYFINNFLGCSLIINERDNTKAFLKASENWVRGYLSDSPDQATNIRDKIRTALKEDEAINVEGFIESNIPKDMQENFKMTILKNVEDEFEIDKTYVEKKLKRIRLKADTDIDIYIDDDSYDDKDKFEIISNGDGSINIVLKNIKSLIEK